MRRDHCPRSSSILGALRGRIRESRRRAGKRFALSCSALEPRALLSKFTVTNTSDSDQDTGSLRWAIEQANADTGSAPVLIDFGIPGTGPFTISPTTPLPTITHSVVIDGYTQPGASANTQAQGDNATILIDLDGGNIPSSDGLTVAANGSTVRGIAVGGFSNGIHVQASDVQLAGDFIGTDPTGTTARSNTNIGLFIDGGSGNTIGGTSAADRNLISGNFQLYYGGQNLELANGATGDLIAGNYIGTDATGTIGLANNPYYDHENGIYLSNAPDNTIGGTASGTGNLISGNGADGIHLDSGSDQVLIQGNLIGTDPTGTQAVGNNGGAINDLGGASLTIGGATSAARNLISANGGGISFEGYGTWDNLIQGNFIGTDITGTLPLGNTGSGISGGDYSSNNTIGGTAPGQGNLISANGFNTYDLGSGILLNSETAGFNLIEGNKIGTDISGTKPLGNANAGVSISSEQQNTIGGTTTGAANLISANGRDGIDINNVYASNNLVEGNFIGSDATGTINLGNGGNGVLVGVSNNTIGGTAEGAANVIAFSGDTGVAVASSPYTPTTLVTILSNSVFGNAGLGIDLGLDGVTPNQPFGNTSAANDGQNYPVLQAAADFGAGYGTQVRGTLNEAPSTTYTLQFFANSSADPSGHGQGQTLLGTTTVTTDGSGNAAFQFGFSGPTGLAGQVISATAADPNGNTSEFSNDVAVVAAKPPAAAANDLYNTDVNTTLTVPAPGVLANDISADGMPFTAALVTSPAHGSVTLNPNGSFTYKPKNGYTGVDSFTYRDVEGTAYSAPATVTINVNPKTYVVTTTADSGVGSLRWAINQANLSNGATPDTIRFNIPGTGVQTIAPATPLPAVTHATIIDGYAQPNAAPNTRAQGDNAVILISLSGVNDPTADGLLIDVAGSTVRGLDVSGFNNGIHVLGNNAVIAGDFIGTDPTGTSAQPNTGVGLLIDGSSGDTIGGTSPADRNLISGNFLLYYGGQNLQFINGATGDRIVGNYIGTDATGTVGLANSPYYDHENGIDLVGAPGNTIGGTTTGAGNLISGNGGDGIRLESGSNQVLIQGNLIGTDPTGTKAVGNNGNGVSMDGSSTNTVGGTSPAALNVISANGGGIGLFNAASNILVQGNFIGVGISGTKALGNHGDGIYLSDSGGNTIGGTANGAGNVISANGDPNSGAAGIAMTSEITGSNLIQGNEIGTDYTGTIPLGNDGEGISITDEPGNTIGGTAKGAGNVISANGADGIGIFSYFASGSLIQGNFIGTDPSGTLNLGNGHNGIWADASSTTIGGTAAAAGNVVAYNKATGVLVTGTSPPTTGVEILSNSIFANGALGIDLGGDGVTPNGTPGPGPNNYQNYPVLTAVARMGNGNTIQIKGSLTAAPGTVYTLQFFANPTPDPSGYGQGQYLIGRTTLTTDSGGNADFQYTFSSPKALGSYISSTATDPSGDTSEFSNDVPVVRTQAALLAQDDQYQVDPGHTLIVAAPGVQSNDIALNGGSFTSAVVAQPSHGTITMNTDGSFIYVPAAGYQGTDSFTYVDTQGKSQSNVATVMIDVNPVTFVVTNTNDSGTGSLRSAITQANRSASPDPVQIQFNIPGTGPFTIAPASDLPTITHSVVIDGYTQPGASPNTMATSDDAVLEVVLSGPAGYSDGLTLSAGNSVIRGLDIVNFQNGIHLLSGSGGDVVSGNFIGVNAAGNASQGNNNGILVNGASGNTIGGTTPDARNVVTSNGNQDIFLVTGATANLIEGNFVGLSAAGNGSLFTYGNGIIVDGTGGNTIGGTAAGAGNVIGGLVIDGIQINASNNTLVEGNIVGTDPTGSIALPNGTGIGLINGSSNNTIGGTVAGAGNAIVDNSGDGVYVDPGGTQDAILSNVIYNNGGLGIDLASGANNNQAPPTLTSATYSSGATTIAGTLSGQQASTTYTLQFFANQTSAPAGAGQGQTLLGTATVTTDGSGDATFTFSFTTQATTGQFVSATATDPNGNTSEFAQNVTVAAGASPAGAVATARVARPGAALASPATTGPASTNVALGSLTDAALNELAGTLARPNRRAGSAGTN